MKKTSFFIPEIMELIDNNSSQLLHEFVVDLHPNDVADIYYSLEEDYKQKLVKMLKSDIFLEIFEEIEINDQTEIINDMPLPKAKELLNEMAPDDRADLFQNLEEDKSNELLNILDIEEKEDVRNLLKYHEESAGGSMTTEYAHIKDDMNTGEAMKFIKKNAEEFETVYYIYVLDKDKVLKGVISLKDFICSDTKTPVTDVMVKEPVYIFDTEDREIAAKLILKYNLLALPVLDKQHRLVGMITHDDIMDIIEEEATEDMVKFGGASSLEETYLHTNIFDVVKTRIFWLIGFLFIASLSAFVLHEYEQSFEQHAWLVFFIPMLVGTAGNAGTQSATIIIRSLATGEVTRNDTYKILFKELCIGLSLGFLLAIVSVIRTYPELGNITYCFTLGLSLFVVISMATFMGSFFPLLADRLNIDPALMSSPLLATFIDIIGLFVYFQMARMILGF